MYGQIIITFEYGRGEATEEELEKKFDEFRDKVDEIVNDTEYKKYFELRVTER